MMKKLIALLTLLALLALFALPALAEDMLGRRLEDFSVQTLDGSTFTLSGALEDKDLVLINLWATWCLPCEMEFPFLEEAYERYADRVAVVALSIEPEDTPEKLRDYAESHGLTFPVGSDSGTGLADTFQVMSIPTSVAVDRFGNVVMVEAGAQTSAAAFEALFEYFLDDGYTESVVLEGFPPARPVAGAPEEALSAAANAEGGTLTFRNPEDALIWPMLPEEVDGREVLVSSNTGIRGSGSAVLFDVTASEGDALAFEFRTSLSKLYDALYIKVDGNVVKRFTGEHDWTAWALPLAPGEHEIAMGCENLIGDTAAAEDRVWIDGVRVISGSEAQALLASMPVYPVAREAGLELEAAGAVRIGFDDPTGVILKSFGIEDGWIIEGDSASVAVTLAEGDDPETALISTVSGVELLASEALKEDGSGYGVTMPLEKGGYDVILLYPGTELGDQDRIQAVSVFSGEDGANAFVDYVRSYGYEAGWSYAED